MTDLDKLKTLYNQDSKHSNYQILSNRLNNLIGDNEIIVKTRYETERLKYLINNIEIKNKTVLDIGGNTGYFTFETIENGAAKVHYYEGNETHADFVRLASNLLQIKEKIEITNKYYLFNTEITDVKYDIILLLNVLHHLGADYGDKGITITNAKKYMMEQINSLADKTSILALQLGFNWKGNRNYGLFKNGTKRELIEFIEKGTKDHWIIEKIGIAENNCGTIVYNDLNDMNVNRDDSLGEFLNRPVFIMKSIK